MKTKIDYDLQDRFDFLIFVPALMLMVIGLLAIYSATVNHPTASGNFNKQLFWVIASLVVFFAIYFTPQQVFRTLAAPSYVLSIFLLIAVLIVGSRIYGAKSWFNLGPFGFQPSEFAKVGTVLFMSYFLTNEKRDINQIKDLVLALAIGFVPIVLIMLEPDLGTSIVFGCITLAMVFWGGISLFALFVVLSPGIVMFASLFGTPVFVLAMVLVVAALIYFKKDLFNSATIFMVNIAAGFFLDYGIKLLQPHQQKRIESFLDPAADPLGSGYNALQAKVAIGSGGVLGRGFLEGNQTQLRFIPQQWTDFIYCVIGEEFGFVGSILTVVLFLLIFIRLIKLASMANDSFSSMLVVGILTIFFVHFAINIGMNVGITPVIGIPLPLLSYGGSSLLTNMVLLGIAMNIYKNRKQHV